MPGPLKPLGKPLWLLALLLVALALALPSTAPRAQSTPAPFDQQTLDELLAPIALYPDALLTQVLIASTYPLEVVQAARFVDRSRELAPDALAAAAEEQPWDPSVIALVRFPSVLAMMDEKLDWMQKLGDAFLAQQAAVMDTVQALRARAQAAGNLNSNAQQTVVVQERIIVIEPAQPQVVYVPFFNPMFVYGNWWWSAPPRWVWVPPPRYRPPGWVPGWGPGWGPGIGWGRPVGVPPWIWHGRAPNWRDRNIVINNNTVIVNNRGAPVWAHNPAPRAGVSNPRTQGGFPPPVAGPGGPRAPDRDRPPARPPESRAAPTHPGPPRAAPPAGMPPPAHSGTRPAARPPQPQPGPSDAAAPPGVRPPPGAPAASPGARPAIPAGPAPAPPAARPAPRPAPQPDAGDSTGGAARPAPPGRNGSDREGTPRPGTSSPPRATP